MQIIGNKIIGLEEVDSTNLYTERLSSLKKLKEGTVVTAMYQTCGKGQGGNIWNSEKGKNILLTVYLTPTFLPACDQFLLNKALTLGACDFLAEMGTDPVIKWPNDLFVDQKKACGILITHRVCGTVLESTIAGFGINLNQTCFPGELPCATSVRLCTGREHDYGEAVMHLCRCLDRRYSLLKEGLTKKIEQEYLQRLRGLGAWQMFSAAGEIFQGRITGVDEFGRLMVERKDGGPEAFAHGEIREC